MSEVKEPLFDKLYAAGKPVFDAIRKPIVRNKLKRKLASAFDDASAKISEAEGKIAKTREDFDNYDVNVILHERRIIENALDLQDSIKEEYLELFGKEMPTEQD